MQAAWQRRGLLAETTQQTRHHCQGFGASPAFRRVDQGQAPVEWRTSVPRPELIAPQAQITLKRPLRNRLRRAAGGAPLGGSAAGASGGI